MPSAPTGVSRCPVVSTTNSPPSTRSAERAKAGALTRNMLCPAIGNSPSDAQTYHELSPPESSLPGRPPAPVPNCQVSAAWTISAVRSGRPA